MIARPRFHGFRASVAWALGATLSFSSAVAAAQEGYTKSPDGHAFRVRFDPESRIRLGFAEAIRLESARDLAVTQAPELTAGISYRQLTVSGAGKARVAWQIDHRFVSGWIQPFRNASWELPAVGATVYAMTALRHDELPSIVLPASPPVSIAFPFDVGVAVRIAEVRVPDRLPAARVGGAQSPVLHIGVAHASMILDPWRSGKPGRSVEIGIGARYDIDGYGSSPLHPSKVLHRVAPMTAGELRFRTQSDDGLFLIDCQGEVVPHWTSERSWKVAAAGSARVERIVAALNDAPIAMVLEGGYRLSPATSEMGMSQEARVSLGVTFNLELR